MQHKHNQQQPPKGSVTTFTKEELEQLKKECEKLLKGQIKVTK